MTYLLDNKTDFAGRAAFNTLFGESVVGWHSDDISVMFQYNNSIRDTTPLVTGSGTITNANEQAIIGIGTAIGTASLSSVDPIRYRPGHEIIAQFTSLYNGAQSGVNQYHGILNDTDGATFGTKDGVFGIWFIDGGVELFVPQSEWSDDKLDGTGKSKFNIIPSNLNIYMVQFGWLGISPIIYSVYTGHHTGWRIVHVIDKVNTVTTPHLNNPSLPISAKINRISGSGSSADIRTSSWRGGVTSGDLEDNSSNRWFAETILDASIVSGLVRNNLFAIQNNTTFQGKSNHVIIELAVLALANDGNKTVAIYGVKGANGTVVVSPTSTTVKDASNSVTTILTGGTITPGLGRGPATVILAGTDRRTDLLGTSIRIYPGETFAFEATANIFTGTLSISVRWIEKF